MPGFLHAGIDFVSQQCYPVQNSETVLEIELCHLLQEIAAAGVSALTLWDYSMKTLRANPTIQSQ